MFRVPRRPRRGRKFAAGRRRRTRPRRPIPAAQRPADGQRQKPTRPRR